MLRGFLFVGGRHEIFQKDDANSEHVTGPFCKQFWPFEADGMMARLGMAGNILFAGLALLALTSCGIPRPTEEMRYRLIVEVHTPEGVKRGSSVIEVKAVKNPNWVNVEGRGTRATFRGQAVAVDLPSGQTLFALLKSEGGASDAAAYPWLAFKDRLRGSKDFLESIRMMRSWKGDSAPMPRSEITLPNGGTEISSLPLLVMFKNINDPASVVQVNPEKLEQSFGAGISLKAVIVQITEEPTTTGIEKRFSWWKKYESEKRRLNGNDSIAISTNNIADNIGTGEFSTRIE